jgi:hypothetical protein
VVLLSVRFTLLADKVRLELSALVLIVDEEALRLMESKPAVAVRVWLFTEPDSAVSLPLTVRLMLLEVRETVGADNDRAMFPLLAVELTVDAVVEAVRVPVPED